MNKIKFRRIKKRLLDNKVKILVISVISLSLFMGVGYAILNARLNINGSARIYKEDNKCDLDITTSHYQKGSWGDNTTGGTVYDIVIDVTNNSAEPIIGWNIKIKGPSDIGLSWGNAEVAIDNGILTLSNLGWNSTLEPGKTSSFEFAITTIESAENVDKILDYITFNGCYVYKSGDPDIEQPDPTVELKSLQINPSEYTMTIDETAPLQVIKTPSNAFATLTWTSSNESIVSVTNDGVITAHAKGTATITVSSGSISATCNITVSGLTALALFPSERTMTVGENLTLTVTKTPSNAPAILTWTSSDNSVVSVTDSGLITALKEGSATITVSSDGINASSKITVKNEIEPPKVDELEFKFSTTYNYDRQIHFKINITNNSNSDISKFSFKLDVPEGTTISLWSNPGATISDNNTFDVNTWNAIAPGQGTEITGLIELPEGYNSADYLSIEVTDVIIK